MFLLEASQLYETTRTSEGQEETHVSVELLLEASQVNSNHDEGIVEVTDKSIFEASRFGDPMNSIEIDTIRKVGVPVSTKRSTAWAVNVWEAWVNARTSVNFTEDAETTHSLKRNISQMTVEEIRFWLPRFVVEVRKENGQHYPPNSLYGLCCGLQRELRLKDRADINVFTDAAFNLHRQVFDSQMKTLNATGKFEERPSDIITESMEDKLWGMNFLGDLTPGVLLDTVFYYVGLCFALRGGDEHCRLRHDPGQIKLYEQSGSLGFLVYTEDVSKSNRGGLLHHDRAPKKVTHYENIDYPQHCLVRLYKLYNEKCPIDRPPNAFYLKPLKNPKGQLWFQKTLLGHNTLSNMTSRIMQAANITCHFTNHSLRSSATTRLFSAHVDEQLIMSLNWPYQHKRGTFIEGNQ